MLRAVAMVAVLSGCSTYAGSKTSAKVGGITILAGFGGIVVGDLLGYHGIAGGQAEPGPAPSVGGPMIFAGVLAIPIGAALAVTSLLGMVVFDKHPGKRSPAIAPSNEPPPISAPLPAVPHAGAKSEAVELHERALGAAQAGDCTTVTLIARRVQELDREYYDADFVISPPIQTCLQSPEHSTHPK